MPRYFLEVAYKGGAYSGFQVQQNQPTIQLALTRALETLFRQPFLLTGSSRTDSGVHAIQNFFHVDTEVVLEEKYLYNINALLPDDITLKRMYPVQQDAHCRFDAVSRTYKYVIYRQKDPFLVDRGWLYPYPVDLYRLEQLAGIVSEYRDFTSFSKRNTQVRTFECQIMESLWVQEGNTFVYYIKANRFLRGMVRGLVGTMLRTAKQTDAIPVFREIIEAKDCTRADFSTPPQGLFLLHVQYSSLDR